MCMCVHDTVEGWQTHGWLSEEGCAHCHTMHGQSRSGSALCGNPQQLRFLLGEGKWPGLLLFFFIFLQLFLLLSSVCSYMPGGCRVSCILLHSLSPFNGHFPGGPGLAGTRMSPCWIVLKLRVMAVMVTTGAIRRAKLQSNKTNSFL